MITAGNTTNGNGNMATWFSNIILLVTIVCCTSLASAAEIRQDYAICKPCTVLPSIITQLFEIFTKRTTARSVVHCAAKCQRTSACLGSVYCLVRDVGQCTLVLKKPPLIDLGLPLLGASLSVSTDSAADDRPVLFPTLGSKPQSCKCVLFPAMLGLSLDRLNLLNVDVGLKL